MRVFGLCAAAAYRRYWAQPGRVLVWRADTRTRNPTVSEEAIPEAYENDPASAAAEFGAEFRTDSETLVTREVVEALVIPDRYELPPLTNQFCHGFVDPSAGSNNSMTPAIGHFEGAGYDRCVLDLLREVQPPVSPETVVAEFAATLGLSHCRGRRPVWRPIWPADRCREHGITYEPAEKPKSDLYRALLPLLKNSGGSNCSITRG